MRVEDMEGYDDLIHKLLDGLTLEQRLWNLTPEQRLSGLSVEQVLPMLPVEILKGLSDAYVGTLSEFMGTAIRARIEGASPAEAIARIRLVASVSAHLPTLPGPLRVLHGPLLVILETWSNGTVVAHLPAPELSGEGTDHASALEALSARIVEFVQTHLFPAHAGKLGGALAARWRALTAMVDVSTVVVRE